MNQLYRATAMAIALGFVSPAMAASEADCKAMWDKADTSNSGHISGKKAAFYIDAMDISGRITVAADRIAAEEFMTACMADVFKNANT